MRLKPLLNKKNNNNGNNTFYNRNQPYQQFNAYNNQNQYYKNKQRPLYNKPKLSNRIILK